MTCIPCITCGRHTTAYFGYCPGCGGSRFQNADSLTSFWNWFKPDAPSKRYFRSYDYSPRSQHSGGFFSGWWPSKLLLFPLWLVRKLVRFLF